jgi:hypothetical protein
MALFPTGLNDSQEVMFGGSPSFPEVVAEPEMEAQAEADFEPYPAEEEFAHPETVEESVDEAVAREAEAIEPVVTAETAPAPVEEPAVGPEPVIEAEQALTVDDFAALEERVLRAVSLVRRERQARAAAEERVAALEAELLQAAPVAEKLYLEVNALRVEREQVRQRVERLLSQLDSLEL